MMYEALEGKVGDPAAKEIFWSAQARELRKVKGKAREAGTHSPPEEPLLESLNQEETERAK